MPYGQSVNIKRPLDGRDLNIDDNGNLLVVLSSGGSTVTPSSVMLQDKSSTNRTTVYADGALRVSGDVNLVNGDIEIGAVEIKDSSTDTRVSVYSSGALRVSGDALVSGAGDYGTVSVTATATQIIGGRKDLKTVIVSPLGTIAIGTDNSVAATTGILLYSGDVYIDSGVGIYNGNLFGITAAGTVDVRYQRRW